MVIHPEKSGFKAYWDLFIYLGLGFNFFLVPFVIAFDSEDPSQTVRNRMFIWELIYDLSYMVHIALKFFTAYQLDVEWVTDIKQIAKTYVKSYFVIDLLSTLPSLVT